MSIDTGNKRPRGRPRVDSEEVSPRIAQPDLGALDRWIADQPDPKPSRADALRLALRDWLTGQGYLKHREPRELRAASKRRAPADDAGSAD